MTKINILVLILAFTVSLAANSSLLGAYYFASDDYIQFDKSIADWFATRGIWRIVGIPLPGWLVSQDVYAFALIAAHAIGGYFFFLVARRGFGSVAYALFLTIIVMAFPWGYEALVWASAAAYVFASCLLWMILWALLSLRADQRQIEVFAVWTNDLSEILPYLLSGHSGKRLSLIRSANYFPGQKSWLGPSPHAD
jgi:hypothetical protein